MVSVRQSGPFVGFLLRRHSRRRSLDLFSSFEEMISALTRGLSQQDLDFSLLNSAASQTQRFEDMKSKRAPAPADWPESVRLAHPFVYSRYGWSYYFNQPHISVLLNPGADICSDCGSNLGDPDPVTGR